MILWRYTDIPTIDRARLHQMEFSSSRLPRMVESDDDSLLLPFKAPFHDSCSIRLHLIRYGPRVRGFPFLNAHGWS